MEDDIQERNVDERSNLRKGPLHRMRRAMKTEPVLPVHSRRG